MNIPEDLLCARLQEQYDISTIELEFLPLGLDTWAGVYRVLSEQNSYFLKAKSGPFYDQGVLFLAISGIRE